MERVIYVSDRNSLNVTVLPKGEDPQYDGKGVLKDYKGAVRCTFNNGFFETTNEAIAKALDEHNLYGQVFKKAGKVIKQPQVQQATHGAMSSADVKPRNNTNPYKILPRKALESIKKEELIDIAKTMGGNFEDDALKKEIVDFIQS